MRASCSRKSEPRSCPGSSRAKRRGHRRKARTLKNMAMSTSISIPKFERFFRVAASLDTDKEDLRRFEDFINRKIRDLVVRAEAFAKANTRDIIMPFDLP